MNGLKLDSALAILRRSNIELAAPPGSPDYLQQVIDGLVTVIAIDPLTGLGNRRRLDEELERQSQLVKRAKFVSVLVADLDGFKRVNDSHGHDIGDSVLRQAAAVVRRTVRDSDIATRMGGEEFAIILPDTDIKVAAEVAERLRRAFIAEQFGDQISPLTVSIGVASLKCGEHPNECIKRADACLYAAKRSGRNRVVVDLGDPDQSGSL